MLINLELESLYFGWRDLKEEFSLDLIRWLRKFVCPCLKYCGNGENADNNLDYFG